MKMWLMWLFGLLLGAASCAPDQERDYQYARRMAAQEPTDPGSIGAGLRLGMPQAQAARRLDSLRAAGTLSWRLPTGVLPMRPYPRYQLGRLTALELVLEGDGRRDGAQCMALQGQLQRAYGGFCYEHDFGREDNTWTWFRGGTEISLSNVVGENFQLTYLDLHEE